MYFYYEQFAFFVFSTPLLRLFLIAKRAKRKERTKNLLFFLRRHLRGISFNATINSNCSINFICRALFRLFYIMLEFLVLTFFFFLGETWAIRVIVWMIGGFLLLDGDNCEWLGSFFFGFIEEVGDWYGFLWFGLLCHFWSGFYINFLKEGNED